MYLGAASLSKKRRIHTIFVFSCTQGGSVEQHRDVLERPTACGALAALVAFSELLADGEGGGKWELGLYDPKRYMRLVGGDLGRDLV